ncbi:MAG: hypothetical protein CR976_01710 [Thiotrichales bacterium]|nr:MAG: hypothetical protein CR976_01710 [Thiotrichales bacterium]
MISSLRFLVEMEMCWRFLAFILNYHGVMGLSGDGYITPSVILPRQHGASVTFYLRQFAFWLAE